MTDYVKKNNEAIDCDDLSGTASDVNRELLKRAISEALESKIRELEKEFENTETPTPSERHKIRMNLLLREHTCRSKKGRGSRTSSFFRLYQILN